VTSGVDRAVSVDHRDWHASLIGVRKPLAPMENFLRVAGEVAREDLDARGGAA